MNLRDNDLKKRWGGGLDSNPLLSNNVYSTASGAVPSNMVDLPRILSSVHAVYAAQQINANCLIARTVPDNLGVRGQYVVELFIKVDQFWFSEVSPRPHDTGMVTLTTQVQSELEPHARHPGPVGEQSVALACDAGVKVARADEKLAASTVRPRIGTASAQFSHYSSPLRQMRIRLLSIGNFFMGSALTIACASLIGGCSMQTTREKAELAEKIQLVWPEPPNEPRFIYETQLRNHLDIRKETEEERLRKMLTGSTNSTEPAFRKPYALAARKGRVYIADSKNQAVVVFDIPRGRVFQIGVRNPNRLIAPISLAIDAERRVYVLDASLKKVMVFDAPGLFLFSVGTPSDLTKPTGVAVSPDGKQIYVVDRGSVENDDHKVIAYNPDGQELFRIGPRGSKAGQVNIPLGGVVTHEGHLLVLDSGNFRVQRFDQTGKFLSQFGTVGNGLGQLSRPRSITADADGNIYVSDASFNNVQIFTPAGDLLMWLGAPGISNLPGKFTLIGAIAVDETGRLYVADQYHTKIEVFKRAAGDEPLQALKSRSTPYK